MIWTIGCYDLIIALVISRKFVRRIFGLIAPWDYSVLWTMSTVLALIVYIFVRSTWSPPPFVPDLTSPTGSRSSTLWWPSFLSLSTALLRSASRTHRRNSPWVAQFLIWPLNGWKKVSVSCQANRPFQITMLQVSDDEKSAERKRSYYVKSSERKRSCYVKSAERKRSEQTCWSGGFTWTQ